LKETPMHVIPVKAIVVYTILCVSVGSYARTGDISQLIETKQLKVVDWEDNPNFIQKLFDAREPVLLRHTPAHKWPATKKWTPQYLSATSKVSYGVKTHNERKFTIGCCELTPMTQSDFWTRVKTAKDEWLYFNAEVSHLERELVHDIGPVHFLPPSDARDSTRVTNVWMSNAGVIAPLHHDPFENFFVQIYGTKRFYLFPPAEWHRLYLYPKTHPRHRQAQVNINDPDFDTFPQLRYAKGWEVVLDPGTVMYLPPLWFHQVEALTDTISVNTWYHSQAIEMMDQAWTYDLPFDPTWSSEQFSAAVQYLVQSIIRLVYPQPGAAADFIRSLLQSRFIPLYHNSSAVDLLKGINTINDPHLKVHLREQSALDVATLIPNAEAMNVDQLCGVAQSHFIQQSEELRAVFDDVSRHVASLFKAAPKDLRDIHLEDWIEDIVGQTVGDKNVFRYLEECFLGRGHNSGNVPLKDEL
jgi:hypothetical protein